LSARESRIPSNREGSSRLDVVYQKQTKCLRKRLHDVLWPWFGDLCVLYIVSYDPCVMANTNAGGPSCQCCRNRCTIGALTKPEPQDHNGGDPSNIGPGITDTRPRFSTATRRWSALMDLSLMFGRLRTLQFAVWAATQDRVIDGSGESAPWLPISLYGGGFLLKCLPQRSPGGDSRAVATERIWRRFDFFTNFA
jgi:hypothetical protein